MPETLIDASVAGEHERWSAEAEDEGSVEEQEREFVRAEIDTSAPFESVKEAAIRFGGIGFWKAGRRQNEFVDDDIHVSDLERQKAQLTAHLVKKESETLDVLKELEHTKRLAGELKSRLQKELLQSQHDAAFTANAAENNLISDSERFGVRMSDEIYSGVLASAPEVILTEPIPAKMNESSVTEVSIELLNRRIEEERNALEMTRKRLAANSSNILALEKEVNQARQKLESMKDSEADGVPDDPINLSEEIRLLSSETEEFKIVGEAAKAELLSAMLEIEQTKSRIKIAEMSLAAANKMKEAAKSSEEAALSELKCLTNGDCQTSDDFPKPVDVRLSQDEYEALVAKAGDAEEVSRKNVLTAMLQVDEANMSKMEALLTLERATEEVKMTRMVMENALRRVETATVGKLEVEEALRRRRSDHSQKRRSAKFKTIGPSQYRKEPSPPGLRDVNGTSLASRGTAPVPGPTLSIGQILSNKLHRLDQPEAVIRPEKSALERHVSLGQVLGRHDENSNSNFPVSDKVGKPDDPGPSPSKGSSKFTFAQFSLRLATESREKKTTGPRLMMCGGQARQ